MHNKAPMSYNSGMRRAMANRMIAFSVLLCFGILMGVSGPHLVHHLDDLHAGDPSSQPNPSRPTDCVVLALLQHIPLAGDFFASLSIFLYTAEPTKYAYRLQAITPHRPTLQARSPPHIFRS
jgi:hypothetical protein